MITTYPIIPNNTPVVLYDLSIPHPRRINEAISFDSIRKASGFLYVSPKTVSRVARTRGRLYSEVKGREFAIRYRNN